jgi:hypothetical protein
VYRHKQDNKVTKRASRLHYITIASHDPAASLKKKRAAIHIE